MLRFALNILQENDIFEDGLRRYLILDAVEHEHGHDLNGLVVQFGEVYRLLLTLALLRGAGLRRVFFLVFLVIWERG